MKGRSAKRRIRVATSRPADYGLLYWPMRDVAASDAVLLQVLVTGTRLERCVCADGPE